MKFSTYRYQEKNSRNTYKHRGCGCFLIIQVSNSGVYTVLLPIAIMHSQNDLSNVTVQPLI